MDQINSSNKSLTVTQDMTDKDELIKIIDRTIEENNALHKVVEETYIDMKDSWHSKSLEERVEFLRDSFFDKDFIQTSSNYAIHYRDVARIIKEFYEIRNRLGALEDDLVTKQDLEVRDQQLLKLLYDDIPALVSNYQALQAQVMMDNNEIRQRLGILEEMVESVCKYT